LPAPDLPSPPRPPAVAASGPQAAPSPPSPAPLPVPPETSQFGGAARDLVLAAERAERGAREILGRAHALCETLARTLDTHERRSARDTIGLLLTAALLSAAAAVLATLVTLSALEPRRSVLDLLRVLLHAG
jgi:hypothetical protein